jgi:hypothetical protein
MRLVVTVVTKTLYITKDLELMALVVKRTQAQEQVLLMASTEQDQEVAELHT